MVVEVSDCEELVGGQLQEMMEMQLPRVLVFEVDIAKHQPSCASTRMR
jgi:hypothetical protein